MISAIDIEYLKEGADQDNLVDLVEYYSNKLPELNIIVKDVSGNYETYTDLPIVYYYITDLRAFARERINAIEECEKDWLSCQCLAWMLEVFCDQLGLLEAEFKKNFIFS